MKINLKHKSEYSTSLIFYSTALMMRYQLEIYQAYLVNIPKAFPISLPSPKMSMTATQRTMRM